MDTSRYLKRRFAAALLVLLIALSAMAAATFAWYVYNTGTHTTNVRMAAGTSSSLQISSSYDGSYGSAAVLEAFTGTLNPVSTNRITNGFQRVVEFTKGNENQPELVASLFGQSTASDYYKTSLFLKTNGSGMKVYLSDIGFEDDDAGNPISTAIRIGIVAHEAGRNQKVLEEYIFSINDADNPQAEYNTATGREGYVLDSTKTDGTTVSFTPYSSSNFCSYDVEAGKVSLKEDSISICKVTGDGNGGYGDAVELEIYIWLEGCDKDCIGNLCNKTLKNLALSFAGFPDE